MASFLDDLIVKKVFTSDDEWELFTEFEYRVGDENSTEIIVVPKGYVTDFASIPRIFWMLCPKDGRYTGAAVLHDFMYTKHLYSRKRCDHIFLEAMEVLNVSVLKRYPIYWAVRTCGWYAWSKSPK